MDRAIKKVVIHCSASKFGSFKLIDKWHKEKGWDGCGYHYIINNGITKYAEKYDASKDGVVEPGRDENKTGAHCYGQNKDSIGICMIGGVFFTSNQLVSLVKLVKQIMRKYNLKPSDVYGHYEFTNSKTCPNWDMNLIRKMLK